MYCRPVIYFDLAIIQQDNGGREVCFNLDFTVIRSIFVECSCLFVCMVDNFFTILLKYTFRVAVFSSRRDIKYFDFFQSTDRSKFSSYIEESNFGRIFA